MPTTPVSTPDGKIIEVNHPDGATDESIIRYAFEQYQVDPSIAKEQSTDYLELTGEMGKGVVRGFGSGLLSAGAGLAELADVGTDFIGLEGLIDSGDENELIRLANEGKQALNESMGVGDAYKDNYLVKLSEGLGSIGSFFVPGLGVGRAAGLLGAVPRMYGCSELE